MNIAFLIEFNENLELINLVDKTDKTDKPIKPISWLDNIDMKEIIETTNLNIKPKYDLIPKDNFTTIRRVEIISLPIMKEIEIIDEKTGKKELKDLFYMEISDNEIVYSLGANSKSLQRSIMSCAIKICNAKTESEVDLSVVLNKLIGLKRVKFRAKGFDAQALQFFLFD